jgi:hypothetical protein
MPTIAVLTSKDGMKNHNNQSPKGINSGSCDTALQGCNQITGLFPSAKTNKSKGVANENINIFPTVCIICSFRLRQ